MPEDYIIKKDDINIVVPGANVLPFSAYMLTAYTSPKAEKHGLEAMVTTEFSLCPYARFSKKGIFDFGLCMKGRGYKIDFETREELIDAINLEKSNLIRLAGESPAAPGIIYAYSGIANFYRDSRHTFPLRLNGERPGIVEPYLFEKRAMGAYMAQFYEDNLSAIQNVLPAVEDSAMKVFMEREESTGRKRGRTITTYFLAPEEILNLMKETSSGTFIGKEMLEIKD